MLTHTRLPPISLHFFRPPPPDYGATGAAGLEGFARAVDRRFPLLSCNLDASGEPALAGLVDRYTIVELPRSKALVGIVGLTSVETPETSNPGGGCGDARAGRGRGLLRASHCHVAASLPPNKGPTILLTSLTDLTLAVSPSPRLLRTLPRSHHKVPAPQRDPAWLRRCRAPRRRSDCGCTHPHWVRSGSGAGGRRRCRGRRHVHRWVGKWMGQDQAPAAGVAVVIRSWNGWMGWAGG